MRFLKVLWGDIKNVSRKRMLAIAVIGITMIPIIYGGLYLAAFWDPYGKTQYISVGIVNLDTGSVIDNEKKNYGNDIVKELKKNNDLKWNFTSNTEKAEEDLQSGKYYAIMIIPSDFSKCLAGVEKGNLKRPEFIFSTNKKKNYVVGLIADKASIALKDKINKKIIDNIGIKVYDSLYKLKDGMKSAADGTSKVKDGIKTMKDQVPTLSSGVNELVDGSNTLTDKLGDAANGSTELKNGIGTLNDKMPDLIDGVSKLLNGSSTLTNKIGDAWDGSKTIRDGVSSLNDKIPELGNGVDKLYDGATSLQDGLHEVNDNMPKLVSGVSDLKDGSDKLKNGIGQLKTKLSEAQDNLKRQVISKKQEISKDLLPIVENFKIQIEGIDKLLSNLPDNEYKTAIQQALNDQEILMQQIETILNDNSFDSDKLVSEINNIIGTLENMRDHLDPIAKSDKLPSQITDMVKQIQNQIDLTVNALKNIETSIGNAKSMVDQLNDGIDQLYDGSSELYNGLDELYDKSNDLQDGIGTLYEGSQNLRDGIGQFKDAIPELQNGVNDLSDGTVDLSDGLMKIHDGSQTLTDKLGELNDKMPDLQSGVQKLYDGSTDLSDGLFKLSDGSKKIRDGLQKIKDKMPDLQSGINKLYDGVATLHDKLADGAQQLADKLGASSSAMGNFMSDPLDMENKPLYDVNGYGEGLAPYFISLGLWVGALLMFFVITDKTVSDEKFGPVSMVLGKYLTYSIIGVFQALFLSFVVIKLGLRPPNVYIYYAFNIFLSLTFIAVMQNFIFLFGDIGRVMSIVALILQLTSSGGTFPGELLPKFFKTIGPFLPFTYSVSAIREISWGIDYNVLNKDIKVLASFLIVSLVLTLVMKKFFGKYIVAFDMRQICESKLKSVNKGRRKTENISAK